MKRESVESNNLEMSNLKNVSLAPPDCHCKEKNIWKNG